MNAEFALILGAIAVGCIVAILFLSGAIANQFGSSSDPLAPGGPFLPPSTVPTLTFPTSVEQCEGEGWRDFPQFQSGDACLEYVNGLDP